MIMPAFGHQHPGDAPAGIAAGRDLAAVGVADAHEGQGTAGPRRLQENELVTTDPGSAIGDGAHQGRGQGDRVGTPVDHHEIVAEPVHLDERKSHAAFIARTRAQVQSRFSRKPRSG